MNSTTDTMRAESTGESALKWVASGSMMEAIGAVATIILAILGLAGVFSVSLAAIGTIVMGAAILSERGSLGATWAFWRAGVAHEREVRLMPGEDSISAEFLWGLAAVILGILAL